MPRRRGFSTSADGAAAGTTHFGFKTVAEGDKADMVGGVFHNVAEKYDVMNDAMSAGLHRLWKDRLLQVMNPQPGTRLLDVAGGTGDISFRFLTYQNGSNGGDVAAPSGTAGAGEAGGVSRAVVCDINESMLEVGKRRASERGYPADDARLKWVHGDAEKLPFDDNSFDVYTIAYGIRNVTHIDQALREAHRVLVPGGRLLVLEFSQPHEAVRPLYDAYSFQVIPVLGHVLAGDYDSYQYLVESIRRFPSQEDFKQMITDAGFAMASYENLTLGVTAIHSGFKLE